MDTTKILDIENDGLNMATDEQFLYVRSKCAMYKYHLLDMSLKAHNIIFKKDGKARNFSICEKYIFLVDFCDLYILDKNDLSVIEVIRLGNDSSSDLGVVRFYGEKAYINIRNGKMAVMDIETRLANKFDISNSSSWEHCVVGDSIYTGTVNGEIIETDINSMDLVRKIELCKKNIYSIVHQNGILYTVSQDMTLKSINIKTLETVCATKKAVKGMTKILGIYNDWLVVADGGISLWDKKTLKLYDKFIFPTGQFNKGVILHHNVLIGSDYNSIYKHTL